MHKRTTAWLLPALLTACGSGDGEDFAVDVKRTPAQVYAPLAGAETGDARLVLPGIRIERTRPSDTEILYTIPGSGDFASTIRFQLEPQAGGAATRIHAFVHIPAVRATLDGQLKELSERKVEAAVESVVKAAARSLEMGSSATSETRELAALLTGVAIATDKTLLAKALDLRANPEKLAAILMAFAAPGEVQPTLATTRDTPTIDPEAGERRHEMAQAQSDWQQEEATEKATRPSSNLDRYDD